MELFTRARPTRRTAVVRILKQTRDTLYSTRAFRCDMSVVRFTTVLFTRD